MLRCRTLSDMRCSSMILYFFFMMNVRICDCSIEMILATALSRSSSSWPSTPALKKTYKEANNNTLTSNRSLFFAPHFLEWILLSLSRVCRDPRWEQCPSRWRQLPLWRRRIPWALRWAPGCNSAAWIRRRWCGWGSLCGKCGCPRAHRCTSADASPNAGPVFLRSWSRSE